jgi:hypothetical protein
MKFAEDQLARWASPPSETERQKMENAERAVRSAISASEKLKARTIRVFAQGSYRNRVNVRGDSDVDVGIVCTNTFFWDGPPGATLESLGYAPGTYHYTDYKREVSEALVNFFGSGSVSQGSKAFDIHANSYRVDADVAPFFEHRRFEENGTYLTGVEMRPATGPRIINWPEQHYANGVSKNEATGRSFKGLVRILKTLRYAMIADGISSANSVSSFLMECLAWNVPNNTLSYTSWQSILRESLVYLFNNTMNDEACSEWGEVSELKYLFRTLQPWTRIGTHKFISDLWDYLELD